MVSFMCEICNSPTADGYVVEFKDGSRRFMLLCGDCKNKDYIEKYGKKVAIIKEAELGASYL